MHACVHDDVYHALRTPAAAQWCLSVRPDNPTNLRVCGVACIFRARGCALGRTCPYCVCVTCMALQTASARALSQHDAVARRALLGAKTTPTCAWHHGCGCRRTQHDGPHAPHHTAKQARAAGPSCLRRRLLPLQPPACAAPARRAPPPPRWPAGLPARRRPDPQHSAARLKGAGSTGQGQASAGQGRAGQGAGGMMMHTIEEGGGWGCGWAGGAGVRSR